MRENEKREGRVFVNKKVCCFDSFVLKSHVGVRGFVNCFEIGTLNRKGRCFCFEMLCWGRNKGNEF